MTVSDLRLPKLPDRTPVKLTVSVSSQLHQALQEYAAAYSRAYGQTETIGDLIPFMLEAFIDADRGFVRNRTKV